MPFRKSVTQSVVNNKAMFSMRIDADIEALDMISMLLSGGDPRVFEEVKQATKRALGNIWTNVRERTPINNGDLRKSILGSEVEVIQSKPYRVYGEVSSNQPYVLPVEEGSRPHIPPFEPILYWVERKLRLKGKEAIRAAWAIRTAIGKRGTAARKMFQDGYVDSEQYVNEEFDKCVQRIEELIANG